eukprot:611857-Ditylum_brightwellii.AAC.1
MWHYLFNFETMILFSPIYWAYGKNLPECIVSNGDLISQDSDEAFYDAVSLSWTTLSTVGYGVVFPAVGSYEKTRRCFGIQFICSLEALVGVLFAGFCGAILYGKVSRVQSIARVLFSDPIVIRYGAVSYTHLTLPTN